MNYVAMLNNALNKLETIPCRGHDDMLAMIGAMQLVANVAVDIQKTQDAASAGAENVAEETIEEVKE